MQAEKRTPAGGAAVLRGRLRAVRRLVRLALLGRGIGRCIAVAFAVAVFSFMFDRGLRFSASQRGILLVLYGGVVVWWLVRELALPLARPMPERQVAREVERRWAGPRDLLSSAVEFAARPHAGQTSEELRREVIEQAGAAARKLAPARLVRWGTVRRALLAGLACALVTALGALLHPRAAELWASRNLLLSDQEWPRATRLELIGFEGRERIVARGGEVSITVRARGVVPRVAKLKLRFAKGGGTRTVFMKRLRGGVFRAELEGLRRSCRFTVEAGDGRLPEHRLRVVARPAIERAQVRITPPEYVGEQARTVTWNAPALKLPRGSIAAFRLTATKRIEAADLTLDGLERVSLALSDERTAEVELVVHEDTHCAFTIQDARGIGMREPLELALHALRDREPEVRLRAENLGESVTGEALIPLLMEASDDYGIEAAWLELSIGESSEEVQRAVGTVSGRSVSDRIEIDLAARDIAVGDRVVCQAFARDGCTIPKPNVGESIPLSFRVVSAAELRAALLVQQQDVRRDVEQQIERQKEALRRLSSLNDAAYRKAELAELAARQQVTTQAMRSGARAYEDILLQLFYNRILTRDRCDGHMAGIVEPLRQESSPGGAAAAASRALQESTDAPPVAARSAMQKILQTLEMVRSRMLLLESYGELVAALEEIAERQRNVHQGTRESYEKLLEQILGPSR